MSLYKWTKPKTIDEREKIRRNFVWYGDFEKRKMVPLGWDIVCTPLSEGGLGTRKLEDTDNALLMRL